MKSDTDECCSKGLENNAIVFRGNIDALSKWKYHGIEVMVDSEEPRSEVGCLVPEWAILRTGKGRIALKKGMLIVHTASICEAGLERCE